jgi:hypothetical protein
MQKGCDIINNDINELLRGKDLSNLKKIDDSLLKYYTEKSTSDAGIVVGTNVLRAVSEALSIGIA